MQIKQLNNRQIAAIVIIAVALLLAIVIGIGTQNQVSNLETPAPVTVASATKLTYYNDGDEWIHQNVIFENVRCKNGSEQTFYVDMYIEPKSSITIDLSAITGYGNEKLPPGTQINILSWKELMAPNVTAPTGDLEMRMQGWSNTLDPQPSDRYYIIRYDGVQIKKLLESINTNKMFIGYDINQLTLFLSGAGAHDQILLIVDADGKVRMIWKIYPELCNYMVVDPFEIPMEPTT